METLHKFKPRTHTQIHTSTLIQGGEGWWMEPLFGVFLYVAVFRNDFTFSGTSFIFLTKFMGGGAVGGL